MLPGPRSPAQAMATQCQAKHEARGGTPLLLQPPWALLHLCTCCFLESLCFSALAAAACSILTWPALAQCPQHTQSTARPAACALTSLILSRTLAAREYCSALRAAVRAVCSVFVSMMVSSFWLRASRVL